MENLGSVSRVYLLEGKVECSAGEQTVQVSAGEMAELTKDGELTVKPFTVESVAAFVGPEVEDRDELTAGLPTSHFKNLENYVDESEMPFETKELLRQIRNAMEAENWWDAGNLAYSTLELENLAGEHVVWTEGESYGNSVRTRYFYSEYDGCRLRISNNIVILPDDWSVRTVQVEIRPELGQGCYIYYGYDCYGGAFDHYDAATYGTGLCENYNWTGSVRELRFNGIGLDEYSLEEPYIIELYRSNIGWTEGIDAMKEYFWND